MMHRSNRWLILLLGIFVLLVLASAIDPYDRKDWWLEIAVPVAGVALLVATFRRFQFGSLAYGAMFLEGVILIIGAHYTHERVPLFDWLKPVFGWERNHYDRFAHFAVGFLLAVPIREIIVRLTPLRGRTVDGFVVVSVLALAGFYEITEWWIAELASPDVGIAYLGSQGDPWDAQKDMLADTLGAVASMLMLPLWHDRQLAAALKTPAGNPNASSRRLACNGPELISFGERQS